MLAASHLTRRFGDRVAVEDLTLAIQRGEIVALLGPNGAGKTTTLRMLAGLIEPTSGEVKLEGTALRAGGSEQLRRRVGLLTEAPGLWDRLTVRQNLLVYARLHDLAAPEAQVDRALDLFDIRDRAGDEAAVLSKGLKQRVALARALLHNPDIVLLDEPTSGLDPESARDVRGLVLRLKDEGHAVLLSTHNLDEVQRVATRVAVLRRRLLAMDTPAALRARLFGARVQIHLTSDAEPFVTTVRDAGGSAVSADAERLTFSGDSDITPRVIRALVERGASISAAIPEEVPLEEIYLRLVKQEPVP